MKSIVLNEIKELVSQLQKEADKSVHDSYTVYILMHRAANAINKLIMYNEQLQQSTTTEG